MIPHFAGIINCFSKEKSVPRQKNGTNLKKHLTRLYAHAIISYVVGIHAGVAQLVEQLICNQQVGGSNPSTSSTASPKTEKVNMGEFPSGQRGQTVNLLRDRFGGPNPPSPTKVYERFRSAPENQRFSLVFFVFRRFSRFFKNRFSRTFHRSDWPFSEGGVDSDHQNTVLMRFSRPKSV